MIKMILLGPPGVGKGTQAALLSKHYCVPILSTGHLLRTLIQNPEETKNTNTNSSNPFLHKIKKSIENGELVDDSIIGEIFKKKFSSQECGNGFILDGFPRTLKQVELLEAILRSSYGSSMITVIDMIVHEEELIKRLSFRFMCTNCGKIYNKYTLKPKVFGVCDVCQATNFTKRIDDNPEVIRTRIGVYFKQTEPLTDYYKSSPLYLKIYGTNNIEEIFLEIIQFLDAKYSK